MLRENKILREDNEKLKQNNGTLEKKIIDIMEFHEKEIRRMKEELIALKQNMVMEKDICETTFIYIYIK